MTVSMISSINLNLLGRFVSQNPVCFPKTQAVMSNPKGFVGVLEGLDEKQSIRAQAFMDEFKKGITEDVLDIPQVETKAKMMERFFKTLTMSGNSNPSGGYVIFL